MSSKPPAVPSPTAEFVVLIALLSAFAAFAIDAMLPALPAIGSSLGAAGNDSQLIIGTFFIGMAAGQLFYGPLADSYGRRPLVLAGFALFLAGCVLSLLARDLPTMLAARLLQGLGAAGPRIVSIAIVRDLYAGRAMARVMSLTMTVFILVPMLAPSAGQGLLLLGSWRYIFLAMLITGAMAMVWFALRMPESLPVARRQPLSVRHVLGAFRETLSNRRVVPPMLAGGFVFGALVSYLNAAPQVFLDLYQLGGWFPVVFGSLAVFVGASSIANAMLVERLGMRRLSTLALRGFAAAAALFLLLAWFWSGRPPLPVTALWLIVTFSCCGLLFGNLNALAMEPVGHIAGAAAALISSCMTLISAVTGGMIARAWDGTLLPMAFGFLCLSVLANLMLSFSAGDAPPGGKPSPAAGEH